MSMGKKRPQSFDCGLGVLGFYIVIYEQLSNEVVKTNDVCCCSLLIGLKYIGFPILGF